MKLKIPVLLASCALLSTLYVANARSIMAVNQQDDYQATLQDLSMALKQQEDYDGNKENKVAKAQFIGALASFALPIVADLVSNALSKNGEEEQVAVQQDDYEAVLQDLYDSMALMEEEEDEMKQAKAQRIRLGGLKKGLGRLGRGLFKGAKKYLPRLAKGGGKLLKGIGGAVVPGIALSLADSVLNGGRAPPQYGAPQYY